MYLSNINFSLHTGHSFSVLSVRERFFDRASTTVTLDDVAGVQSSLSESEKWKDKAYDLLPPSTHGSKSDIASR